MTANLPPPLLSCDGRGGGDSVGDINGISNDNICLHQLCFTKAKPSRNCFKKSDTSLSKPWYRKK